MSSKQHPRKLSIYGSNGVEYNFLLKGTREKINKNKQKKNSTQPETPFSDAFCWPYSLSFCLFSSSFFSLVFPLFFALLQGTRTCDKTSVLCSCSVWSTPCSLMSLKLQGICLALPDIPLFLCLRTLALSDVRHFVLLHLSFIVPVMSCIRSAFSLSLAYLVWFFLTLFCFPVFFFFSCTFQGFLTVTRCTVSFERIETRARLLLRRNIDSCYKCHLIMLNSQLFRRFAFLLCSPALLAPVLPLVVHSLPLYMCSLFFCLKCFLSSQQQ